MFDLLEISFQRMLYLATYCYLMKNFRMTLKLKSGTYIWMACTRLTYLYATPY